MVGRCQVALIQKFGAHGVWDRAMLARMIETVFAAAREPTGRMIHVAMRTNNIAGSEWRAMIDEARGVTPTSGGT